MTKDEALKLALEALENNKQTHYYCEDTWYSCPQHEEGCANDSVGDECNCGADKANAEIDKVITAIKEALAQPQRTWVGLTRAERFEIEKAMSKYYDYQHECKTVCLPEFAAAIEAKLKQKNGYAEENT